MVRGMEIVDLAIQDWLRVEKYEIVGAAHAASIAFGSGEAHVRVLRLGAGSAVSSGSLFPRRSPPLLGRMARALGDLAIEPRYYLVRQLSLTKDQPAQP